MSVTVVHEKRKQEILENALDVFVEEGYADTTFQKIADRCGITRTILYLYFKNKREIFLFSLKRFTDKLEAEIKAATKDISKPVETLIRLSDLILDVCHEHKKLLTVIVNYIQHSNKAGTNSQDAISRRTIKMRHIISGIVITGQQSGQLREMPIANVSNFFYSMAETAIFKTAILGVEEYDDIKELMHCFFDGLRSQN